jgi:capsular exopolysaccharide synthesis family protein
MLRALGLIGGGLIGMVIALLRENLDRTFRTARQVEEATNLPVLGVLPPSDRLFFGGARAAAQRSSPFGLAIGNVLERLVFAPEAQGRKVLMLTSATPQEGKSRIAVALARLAARHGIRAIVLDCDWRQPALNRYFSGPAMPGLGDLLAGVATPDEVVYRDPVTGAHAIFAGDISRLSSSAERFDRLRLLQATLARHYDLVIVDTPPVLAGPDALALARMVEEVAFVVRWGVVSRDVAVDAIRKLAFSGATLGGVILSQVDPKRYRRYGMGDVVYPYPNRPIPRAT